MAQQEPQWIVTSRDDGTNVNDWHWVERDCLPYLRAALSQRCAKATFVPCDGAQLDSEAEVSGEATANNRRGKTIFLYELEFTFRLKLGGSQLVTVTFPYVGEDNEGEEYEVKITGASSEVRDGVRARALGALRVAIRDLIVAMKQKFSKPREGSVPKASPAPEAHPASAPVQAAQRAVSATEMPPMRATGDEILIEERFTNASPQELFECLLDAQRMSAVTAAPAVIRPQPGAKFELFGGQVTGEIVDLVKGERIVQTWRFRSWPEGHHSFVEMRFWRAGNGDAILELKQTAVPHDDRERTEHGWRANFFDRMRALFGYGGPSHLF